MGSKKVIIIGVVAVLFVGLAALLFIPKDGAQPGGVSAVGGEISNEQLLSIAARGARLVDVRTAPEYEGAHLQGAANVPVDQVPAESASWDKAQPVVVYCETGSRSAQAADYLRAQGFKSVYNLTQGMSGWDGEVVRGGSHGGAGVASADADIATGKPTFYAFMSDG